MRWIDSLLIGLAQVISLIPGVSRSGSTITSARGLRFDRESAAEFSFLMSMPIIAAAVVIEGPKALRESGVARPDAVRHTGVGDQRLAGDLDSDALREQTQLRHFRFLSGGAWHRRPGGAPRARVARYASMEQRTKRWSGCSSFRAWSSSNRQHLHSKSRIVSPPMARQPALS
jgi:hypothetical protein